MANCLQCGKCCLGLEWTFTFEAEGEDPENPSDEVLGRARRRMRFYGLLYHKFKGAEVKDENKLAMTFDAGVCQHLDYKGGKAFCEIHDKRPQACRKYFCEKANKN